MCKSHVMKKFKNLLFALLTIFSFYNANAYTIQSTNGYDVEIELTLDNIQVVSSGCSGGWYNFQISYSYDISFTGANAPSSMYTLQATSPGNDGSTFIWLPNSGGTGSQTSSTVTRNVGDCATATPSGLGFDSIFLQIQGPGIATQTIHLPVTALPVELLDFSIDQTSSLLNIQWSTATEIDNDYFTIEKSIDGANYVEVATVQGAGNSMNVLNYSTTDIAPTEVTYYRLKQTDFDGKFTYSKVIVVKPSKIEDQPRIYPNPSSSQIAHLNVGSDFESKQIEIMDASGKRVMEILPTTSIIEVEGLSEGFYFISIYNTQTGVTESLKFVQK